MSFTTRERVRRERRAHLLLALRGAALLVVAGGCVYLRLNSGRRGLFAAALSALLALLAVLGLALVARGLVLTLPVNSLFLRSLRSQGEEGETLEALAKELDGDLARAAFFGTVAVGSLWVVGEQAMRLSRTCGVFSVPMGRLGVVLCLVDGDGNVQATPMESSEQLAEAVDYLRKALPLAATGELEAYRRFMALEAGERWRHAPPRERRPWEPGLLAFWGADGVPTSNFSRADALAALEGLEADQAVGFTLLDPVEYPDRTVLGLFAEKGDDWQRMAVTYENGDGPGRALRAADGEECREAFCALMDSGTLPDFAGWTTEAWTQGADEGDGYELHVDGDAYRYTEFGDVEAVLDGMDRGEYRSFSLMRPDRRTGGLFVDKDGKDYKVMAAAPSDEGIRWLETVTQRKDQVLFWAEGYYNRSAFPYFSGWDDITAQMERER